MYDVPEISSRRMFFIGMILAMFTVFVARLVQLQVLYQDVYGKKSEENSIRLHGQAIEDSNGKANPE